MPDPGNRPSDAGRLLSLLWPPSTGARRGPDRSRTLNDVVDAAITIANRDGLAAVTMRAVAAELGVGTMTLYHYVPSKASLVALMIDRLYEQMPRPPLEQLSATERLQRVARLNRELFLTHSWLADTSSARPPLGPGLMAKYEYELNAFTALGLDDVSTDDCLIYLLTFVHGAARADLAARRQQLESGITDQEWWNVYGPLFDQIFDKHRYPTAARIGGAAGATRGAAYNPDQAFDFGLERTIDAINALGQDASST